MLAGMGGVSYSALTAAVSNAGGYGCLGASTMSYERLGEEIEATRALTSLPFGVDLLTAFPDTLVKHVELLIEGGASTFVAGLGVPSHVVELCHDHGVLVISMCGKVDHARRALDAGCDVVVAQGTEAGGHTGTVATFPLVPMVVDAVGDSIPVVAAGGVFDGRGLAAALALGADGVWVGTRFIATPEARALPGYRERIVAARPVIKVDHLTKRYADTLAVDDLDFEVNPGVVTGFLGPNGSGKSTTMRIILGLDHATRVRPRSTASATPS
jgi:enoyl-[acyl-carrier protein] reductase II